MAFFNRAFLLPGCILEMHTAESEEIHYILEGEGLFMVGDESTSCCAGDAIHIPAGVSHGLINNTGSPITYLVLGPM